MAQEKFIVAMLEVDSDDRYLTVEVLADLGFDLQIDFFPTAMICFLELKIHAGPDIG